MIVLFAWLEDSWFFSVSSTWSVIPGYNWFSIEKGPNFWKLKPKGEAKAEGQDPAQPSQGVQNTPPKYKPKTKKQKEQEMKNIRGKDNEVKLDFENPSKPSDLFVM